MSELGELGIGMPSMGRRHFRVILKARVRPPRSVQSLGRVSRAVKG